MEKNKEQNQVVAARMENMIEVKIVQWDQLQGSITE